MFSASQIEAPLCMVMKGLCLGKLVLGAKGLILSEFYFILICVALHKLL